MKRFLYIITIILISIVLNCYCDDTIYKVPRKRDTPDNTSSNDNSLSNDDTSSNDNSLSNDDTSSNDDPSSPSSSSTRIPTSATTYTVGPTRAPTQIPTSYVIVKPTIAPTQIPTLATTTHFPTRAPTPSNINRTPTQNPSNINLILISTNASFEFFIYNSTINNASSNIIATAISKYVFNSIESKVSVSITNNKNIRSNSRYLQENNAMDAVQLNILTPFKNIEGDTIDSSTSSNLLRNSILDGSMQFAIRSTSKQESLQWVVVCLDESCSNRLYVTSMSNEACTGSQPTKYDTYYGWSNKLEGYIVWLILLVLIWFGLCVLTAAALISRYYTDFSRIREIKCMTSFCVRSTHLTLASILETSKFIVGCVAFNLCISRTFSLLMIIVLTISNELRKNFACVEFSFIQTRNDDAYSKLYVIVYTCYYPLLLLAVIGRQIWHDAELRRVGFVHLLADSRFHLKIAMILRKVAALIAAICVALLLTLLVANFAMTSSDIIKAVQSVQLVCAISIIILQSYRTYGARNIKLEIRSPFDGLTHYKPKTVHTNANSFNRFNNSSSLDDVKEDDEIDRLERIGRSEKTDDEEQFQPRISDIATIILTLSTASLSIITAVPYLFNKALLSLIVFSIITRISEILTCFALISTFKVQNMSLQQLVSRELRERVDRVLNSSSLSSTVTKIYRSSVKDNYKKDYMRHDDDEGSRVQYNEDHQSLISDLTTTTKHPFYSKLSPIHDESNDLAHEPLASGIDNEDGAQLDDVPRWVRKWESSDVSLKESSKHTYCDLEQLILAGDLNNIKEQEMQIASNSESTASSFGSHWNNIVNRCNDMSNNHSNRNNRDIIRASKLEM